MAYADLTGSAKAVCSTSSITDGRERLKIDELIATYPDGVSINGFSAFEYMGSPIYSYTFNEDSGKFFSGGGDLFKMGQKWAEEYSIDDINESLAINPVKVKIKKVRTKGGKTYTKVDVLSKSEVSDNEVVDPETGEIKPKADLFDNDDAPF